MRHGTVDADDSEPGDEPIVAGLRTLGRVAAPPHLAERVLTETGIVDRFASIDSPVGRVFVAWNRHGVSAVDRMDDGVTFATRFERELGRPVVEADALPPDLEQKVGARLRGEPARIRFDLRGRTRFEHAVLEKALEIPFGEVRPYSWIAREIGHPAAVRAVGTALGHNPIPLLIPCHRVVRADGHIGQYGLGGPAVKRSLLSYEGAEPDTLEALARSGLRYSGSDTTHVYCHPTCRHAKRVSETHRVWFSSARTAAAAGYRACKVCRPESIAA